MQAKSSMSINQEVFEKFQVGNFVGDRLCESIDHIRRRRSHDRTDVKPVEVITIISKDD